MGRLPCQRNVGNLPSDARKICPVPAKTHSAIGNLATPIDNPDRACAPLNGYFLVDPEELKKAQEKGADQSKLRYGEGEAK